MLFIAFSEVFKNGPIKGETAAFGIRISIPPNLSIANFTNFFMSYKFPALHAIPSAVPPSFLIKSTAS